ncbi:Aldehyde dehydrogenase, thermostable [compost metagenome]
MPTATPTVPPRLQDALTRHARNLIGGVWKDADSGSTFPVINPADPGEILARFPASGPADVQAAVDAAREALPSWSATPAPERARILDRALSMLEARAEELAYALTWEEGKALADSRVEIRRGLDVMRYFAGEGRRLGGQTLPSALPNMFAFTQRRPLGVVGLITPWNFPFAIPAWKLAPALITGNTVVFKPAEQTPLCAVLLVEILEEAGLPPGVVNLIHGDGAVGKAIVAHPQIRGISFTGSTVVGKEINVTASSRLAKVQLELGGKNAAIVLEDADLDLAAREIAAAAWGSSGQRCTATSRLIVQRSVAKALVDKLLALAPGYRVGSGFDPEVKVGPVIEPEALDRIGRYVDLARQEGANVVMGGKHVDGDGYFCAPTVITGVSPQMTVAQEEIFGPVLSVIEVEDLAEAIAVSNDVSYGLSSALYTRDLASALRYSQHAETGLLHVNCSSIYSEIQLPFGGIKDSGFGGREMGPTALDFYTEWQTVYMQG